MSLLYNFLQKNSISAADALPLVHTSKAQHLKKFLESNEITATECDVFRGEKLNYFFVGRPAYKFELSSDAEFWQLPICFIIDFNLIESTKRVFPFDSGGFSKGMLPEMLTSHDLNDFEVSGDANAPSKIVGTFFGNARNYYKLKGRTDQDFFNYHDVSMLESEVHAIHRLSQTTGRNYDDRCFSIEKQISEDVSLKKNKVLAIIVPSPYMDDAEFLEKVELTWGCQILSYDVYPLNPSTYYYGIYSLTETFFRELGLF